MEVSEDIEESDKERSPSPQPVRWLMGFWYKYKFNSEIYPLYCKYTGQLVI